MKELIAIRGLSSSFLLLLRSGAVPSKFSVWENIDYRLLIYLLSRPQAKGVLSTLDLSKLIFTMDKSRKRKKFEGPWVDMSSFTQKEFRNTIVNLECLKTLYAPAECLTHPPLNWLNLSRVEVLYVIDNFNSL